MIDYLSEKAMNIKPYVPGEQPKEKGWIKLNTNENPYPPNDYKSSIMNCELNKYPDPECTLLREKIAGDLGLKSENIFVGNGSDEVLAIAFQTFFTGKEVSMPDISYSFYPVWADMYDVKRKAIPTKNYEINWNDYSGNCIIANPNAPTSLAINIEKIPRDGVVIIDEAYIDFSNLESAVRLINDYDNLLVVRTFSKSYCLAGLRVGYAVGNKNLIDGMNKIKHSFNSYPVSTLAQKIALSTKLNIDEVIKTREWLKTKIDCLDSQTNFVWWKVPNSKEMYDYLFENKILVRYWPEFSDRLRVTIGTQLEMVNFLKKIDTSPLALKARTSEEM